METADKYKKIGQLPCGKVLIYVLVDDDTEKPYYSVL